MWQGVYDWESHLVVEALTLLYTLKWGVPSYHWAPSKSWGFPQVTGQAH